MVDLVAGAWGRDLGLVCRRLIFRGGYKKLCNEIGLVGWGLSGQRANVRDIQDLGRRDQTTNYLSPFLMEFPENVKNVSFSARDADR